MKAQDIEFVKSEAISIKTDGYAKRSKLPRRTANAIIVRNLSEAVDIKKPRSNYVNVLMEIGISRRSAYRLVDEAYKAKAGMLEYIEDTTEQAASPLKTTHTCQGATDDTRVDIGRPESPVRKNIAWPPEIDAGINRADPNITELMVAAYGIGVMVGKKEVTKEEITVPLGTLKERAKSLSAFLPAIIVKAANGGVKDGEEGSNRRAPVEQFFAIDDSTAYSDKPMSVFIPSSIGKKEGGDIFDRMKRLKEEKERLDGLLPAGFIVQVWDPKTSKIMTDRNGAPMIFDKLSQAIEFAEFMRDTIILAVKTGTE